MIIKSRKSKLKLKKILSLTKYNRNQSIKKYLKVNFKHNEITFMKNLNYKIQFKTYKTKQKILKMPKYNFQI